MGYRGYSPSNGFLVATDGTGDFTTLAAALTAATSGKTIYLHGTVTENPTLKPGVNIVAWDADAQTPSATIIGTCTLSSAGTVSISGINLQTNSAFAVVVSGSAACRLNISNCNLNFTNNTGISFTNSNASSMIFISNSEGDLGTTGIGIWSMSSIGNLLMRDVFISNTGNSITASSNSAGSVGIYTCSFASPLSVSGAAVINIFNSVLQCEAINSTSITTAGTGTSQVFNTTISSGTASALSIGVGTVLSILCSTLTSSNTNVVTGAGNFTYADITFPGVSSGINASIQTPVPWKPYATSGTTGTAIRGTAGFDSGSFSVTNGFVTFTGGGSSITIAGDTGSTAGSSFTFTGGTSGAFYTMSSGTMTTTFNYLALPNTTNSAPTGTITFAGTRFAHNFNSGVYFGSNAGNLTTSTAGTGFGNNALGSLTSGLGCTAVGNSALANVTDGSGCTAVGASALLSYIGAGAGVGGCIAIGTNALDALTTGQACLAIGTNALGNAVTTIQSLAIGNSALGAATGNNNVAIGNLAGNTITSGTDNTIIGRSAGTALTSSESSNIIIGSTVPGTLAESNAIHIGAQGSGTAQQNKCFIAGITGVTTTVANRQLVTINSSTIQVGTSAFSVNYQVFTSSGTYTPTSGMVYCIVKQLGGGGAGGGAQATGAATTSAGGGGGGGEYAEGTFSATTIGASQTVTIGAAGSGSSGAAGGNGGNTSLGALMSANGGSGGATVAAATNTQAMGGAGGTGGSGGSVRSKGYNGLTAVSFLSPGYLLSGQGANSQFGSGALGVITTGTAGSAAAGFGAGGSGGANYTSQSANAGGAGTAGYVVITEYIIA